MKNLSSNKEILIEKPDKGKSVVAYIEMIISFV